MLYAIYYQPVILFRILCFYRNFFGSNIAIFDDTFLEKIKMTYHSCFYVYDN